MIPGGSQHHHLYSNFPPPVASAGHAPTQQQQQGVARPSGSTSTSSPPRPLPPHLVGPLVHLPHHHAEQQQQQQEVDQEYYDHHHHHHHHHHHQQQHYRSDYHQQLAPAIDNAAQFHQDASIKQEREDAAAAKGRAYRSRKNRPCDTCRKRKSRCIIDEYGQDCQSCRLNGRSCTFDISPTPRSRPVRDENGVVISSGVVPRKRSHSKEKSDASRSPSTSFTTLNNAGGSGQEPNAIPRRVSLQRANSPEPLPPPPPYAIQSIAAPMRKSDSPLTPLALQSRLVQNSLVAPVTSLDAPISAERNSGIFEPPAPPNTSGSAERKQSAFVAPALPRSSSSALRRTSLTSSVIEETERREDVPRSSEKATSDQLYGLLSEVMHGHGRSADAASPASSLLEEEHDDPKKDFQPSEDEKADMMPVVLGSSSSEDPHLLRQAGSPPPSRQGGASSPANDHMSVSSRVCNNMNSSRDMPPPPTPDTQSSMGPRSNVLGPLQVRQVTNDPHRPIFFAYVPSNPYGRVKDKGREIGSHGLAKLIKALQGRIGPLMVLYAQRDATAFPLLTESQRRKFRETAVETLASINTTPPSIPLPAVLATATLATPTVYDVSLRPISKHAWGANLHALMAQFETSTIVTLQVALTDLTGRPSINTSGNFMTFNQTLAISHMLGLHLDPTGWNLPREEKDVRIRLWWATVIHDKWSSLCWGRPSTIHRQDFSVPLPRRSNLSPCQEHLEDKDLRSFPFGTGYTAPEHAHTPGDTFAGLCRLTLILGDVLDEFHSVRALHILHRDAYGVAERIKSYFVSIEEWLDALPETLKDILKSKEEVIAAGSSSIPGTRSLHLSYLGVQLLLCRTALDAVTTKGTQDLERLVPAHKTALHAALMCVEFLESLSAGDFGGFFLHYGAHHLASCLSLLARLCFGFSRINEKALLATCIGTLQRLLVVLSESHRLYKWDLAELALTRSRAILPSLETRIDDFPKMFPAVYEHVPLPTGGSSPSPFIATDADARTTEHAQNSDDRGASNDEVAQRGGLGKALQAASASGSASKAASSQLLQQRRTGIGNAPAGGQDRQIRDWRAGAINSGEGVGGSGNSSAEADRALYDMHAVSSNQQSHEGPLYDYRACTDNGTVSVPVDAVGLPYPLGMNNAETLSYLSSSLSGGVPTVLGSNTGGASHLLSSMEVDWLGMGLGPDTYPAYYTAPGPA